MRRYLCPIIILVIRLLSVSPLYAQLKELEITESEPVSAGVVFRDYEDKAAILIISSITNLRFESNLGIVDDKSEPEVGTYRLIVLPRRQILTVKAVGFREGRIQLSALDPRDVAYYTIEPKGPGPGGGTGTLVIETEPPGATITSFGGVPTNLETPYTIEDQPSGSYRLVIEKENYLKLDTVVVVQRDVAITQAFRLRHVRSLLVVRSDPAGANVFLNEEQIGVTPVEREVGPGRYQVRVEAEGYIVQEESLEVSAGVTLDKSFALERLGMNEVGQELSRGSAMARSAIVPGLGQFYKGQSEKGILFFVGSVASLGAAVLFSSQVHGDEVQDLGVKYQTNWINSIGESGCMPGGPCENADYRVWEAAYDDAESKKSLAVVALGVGAGIWLLNLIDSATGFPRERSVADSRLRVQAPHPHVIVRQGTPHYGFRFKLMF